MTPRCFPKPSGSLRWDPRPVPGEARSSPRELSGTFPGSGFKNRSLPLRDSYIGERPDKSRRSFCSGQDPSFHLGHPHGKAPGSRHSKRQTYPGHRSLRFRKDHPGTGKPGPRLESLAKKKKLPDHVCSVEAPDIKQVKLIDATPIGINVRSTVATYANIHDELRKTFAKTPSAKEKGWKAGAFSYNTGALRCRSATAPG